MGYNLKDIMRNIFLGRSLQEALPKTPENDSIVLGHGVNRKEVAKRRRATKLRKKQQKHMRKCSRK
jgi:hypothetical protein